MAATPESWVALEDAKKHLNVTGATSPDDLLEITAFIRRAERGIVALVGHVKPPEDPIAEYHHGGRSTLRVNARPIGSVESIAVQGVTVPAADLDTGGRGWYLDTGDEGDLRAGIIRHTDRFPSGFVKVTFKPGRDPVPEDLTGATLELLRHLWQTQRGTGGARPGMRGEASVDPPEIGPRGGAVGAAGFTYPKRVMELLQTYRLPAVG